MSNDPRVLCAVLAGYVAGLGCLGGVPMELRGDDASAADGAARDTGILDASVPDGRMSDAGASDASGLDGMVQECVGQDFECLGDGTARACHDEQWVDLGSCLLGCDAATRECFVPSNVPSTASADATGALSVTADQSPMVIDTDTGEIRLGLGIHRPAQVGLHPVSGIAFSQVAQGSDPGLGVFSLASLWVDPKAEVLVEGSRALVLLLSGQATLYGTVTVSAKGQVPGSGGFAGGDPELAGGGPCPGVAGQGEMLGHGCSSGGGGGGHGGVGGAGGSSLCGSQFPGGAGGADSCGSPTLQPLVGGSGGAGGAILPSHPATDPGPGGGGGGAIQLSVGGILFVAAGGGINTGGGGGGFCTTGGGAGGGAGGAILLEAPHVILAVGAILAANGGGGGGGDCT